MTKGIIYSVVSNDILYDQRVRRIADSLEEDGYEVHILGRKKLKSITAEKQWHLLSCYFKKSKWFYLEFNIRIFFFLLTRSFDYLIANDLDSLLAVKLICSIKRKKFVFDAHEIFTEVPELIGKAHTKNIWTRIGKWGIPSASLCLTVNNSLKKVLGEKYASNFHVIMNRPVGVDQARKQIPRQDLRIVLYQGAVNKGRGLEETILAIKEIPNVQLLIAGDGDEFDSIKKELEKNKYHSGKVSLLGKLKPSELHKLTATASIGINVLLAESLNYQYSLANKFFDYAHAGVPSINMNFPEYVDHINQFKVGLCIDELSPSKIKEAIIKLLNDKELYNEIFEACQKARKLWLWEKESEKLIRMFNTLSD